MSENYERILEKISRASGVEKEELERRVEAKRAKLSGLISKEGAAQVIAAELGINFDNEKLKIQELLPGMRKAMVVGKVINIFPVRSFTSKQGKEGKVSNLIIADDTSNIKVVLWDTHHIDLVEKGEIKEGTVIEISNASVRENELHLGSFSELKKSSEVISDVIEERVTKPKTISELKIGDNAKVRAFIVQSFEPRFFHICPECKKKAEQDGENFVCKEHGKVVAEKRALVNIVLDDGTETIRTVLFHENLVPIGLTALEDTNLLIQQKENLLGKEFFFAGNVRKNSYFNNEEFIVNNVEEVNLDNLIQELEKA